ncbi:MAG: tetratricopeptide repeat protein, partial [Chloroflexi bacterium]|nr:tetratricopeptide repeat protein [Chloroflexota bacterium]
MDLQLLAIIVGVPGALAALIVVGATLRRMLRRDGATHDEHDSDTAETTHRIAITVDQPGVPGAETEVSYWAGRPESLGDGFYGREDELGAIASSFAEGRAVVISGGAGSGKSRLAAEHAHRAKVDGFWTAGGTDLASTLAGLAPELGIDVAGKSDDEIAGEVQRGLAGLSPETLWVVENLADLEQVNALLNGSGSVRLLITTRDSRRHLLPSTVAYHWIEVLEPDAAKALLCSRSKTSSDDPTVALIADKVGRLPLALEVLAVRLGELRQSPERVLEQLEQAPTVLQMETFRQALGATIPRAEGVFASIRGTMDDLGEQDRDMLSGLAYVADATVPEALAAALMGVDDEGLTGLLSRCSRQSVLSWSEGQVRIHALTVAVLAATSPEGSVRDVLGRARLRLKAIDKDDPVALRAELVHHEAMHSHAQQQLGVEDESVLSLQHSLAIGYWTAGRNDDAIRLDEQTLEMRERVLGPEHPETLTSRSNLAVGYRDAGRIDDAIRLHEQTLELRERVLGPGHPRTLRSRSNLALGYRAEGRIEDTIRLDEQTLEVRERVLGPEHPDTLGSRNNLALGYRAAGRIDDAVKLNEQTLEV